MNKITKLGRNESCHCGSGRKYKSCCIGKDELDRTIAMFVQATGSGKSMALSSFDEHFPEIAENETRHFWPNNRNAKSDPPIRIMEFYCTDPTCECNRVLLKLIDFAEPATEILTVNYAFDRNDPEPGPYIDPLNSITPQGRDWFPFVCELLRSDITYVARLRRHYQMMKAQCKRNKAHSQNITPLRSSRVKSDLLENKSEIRSPG